MKVEHLFFGASNKVITQKKVDKRLATLTRKGLKAELKEIIKFGEDYYTYWLIIEGNEKDINRYIKSLADAPNEVQYQFSPDRHKIIKD